MFLNSERDRKQDQHVAEINRVLKLIERHPHRATAAYLLGVLSVHSGFKADNESIEVVLEMGLASPIVTKRLIVDVVRFWKEPELHSAQLRHNAAKKMGSPEEPLSA